MEAKPIEKIDLNLHSRDLPQPGSRLDPRDLEERRQLVRAIREINAAELFGEDYELTFILNRETNRPVMRLVDRQTGEVVRQLPPELSLRLAERLRGR